MKKRSYLFMLLLAMSPFFTNCGGGSDANDLVIRPLSLNGVFLRAQGGPTFRFESNGGEIGVGETGTMFMESGFGSQATTNNLGQAFAELYYPDSLGNGGLSYEWVNFDPASSSGTDKDAITVKLNANDGYIPHIINGGEAYTLFRLSQDSTTPTYLTMTFSASGGFIDNVQVVYDDPINEIFVNAWGGAGINVSTDIRAPHTAIDEFGVAIPVSYENGTYKVKVPGELQGNRLNFYVADFSLPDYRTDSAYQESYEVTEKYTKEKGRLKYFTPEYPNGLTRQYEWITYLTPNVKGQQATLTVFDVTAVGENDVFEMYFSPGNDVLVPGNYSLNNGTSGLKCELRY